MNKFELILSNMCAEELYAILITGHFNCRSPKWSGDDIETDKGKKFEPLMSELGLFLGIKSCIDFIFTDQPNLFIEFGIHPSLHEQCYPKSIYG